MEINTLKCRKTVELIKRAVSGGKIPKNIISNDLVKKKIGGGGAQMYKITSEK